MHPLSLSHWVQIPTLSLSCMTLGKLLRDSGPLFSPSVAQDDRSHDQPRQVVILFLLLPLLVEASTGDHRGGPCNST
jgi:hypothetical protein